MPKAIYHVSITLLVSLCISLSGCKKEKLPVVTTLFVTDVTGSGASCGGVVTDQGSSHITARGVCYGVDPMPTTNDYKTKNGFSEGIFETSISGLESGKKYYIRAYAENDYGTGYGSVFEFITSAFNEDAHNQASIKDIDGNNYSTVAIGEQIWMKENMRTLHYSNGDPISTTSIDNLDISNQPVAKYQWPCSNGEDGRYYTFYTITDSRNVCPAGWHVPTDDDWTRLTDYLSKNNYGFNGNPNFIAKSLAATSGWIADTTKGNVGNNQLSNNKSGFTGTSSGGRFSNGIVYYVGLHGIWWSSTGSSPSQAFFRCIGYLPARVYRGVFDKTYGLPVRCIKNN
jgi:uncharacterized protein (TIGR02145 family)